MNVIMVTGIYDLVPSRSLGSYLLRHVLEKRRYTCQVIDHCQEFTGDELYKFITHFIDDTTVCIGLSTTFWLDIEHRIWKNESGMPPNIYEATKRIKKDYPGLKLVLGGPGVRYATNGVEHIDAMVIGEAEDLFPDLLDHWTKGTAEPLYEIRQGIPYYNQCVSKTYDISTCDFQWSDRDIIFPGEPLPMETARGCIFKCRFCSYPHLGKKKFDYLKPVSAIKAHMQRNYDKWGVQHYIMLDDTFNDSEQKIDEFLSMTESLNFNIGYVAYIRADLLHRFKGQAEKLQKSGLTACFFGLESLHPLASQAVGKGWSGRYAKEYLPHLIKDIWKNNVNVTTGFIAGLPGEDEQSLIDTLDWVNNHNIEAFWTRLSISNLKVLEARGLDASLVFTSEFERNSEQYGYKFDKLGFWYNDIWTARSAEKFVKEQLNSAIKNKRLTCWSHIQLMAFGYTENEIKELEKNNTTGMSYISNQEFKNKKQQYIKRYKERLLDL